MNAQNLSSANKQTSRCHRKPQFLSPNLGQLTAPFRTAPLSIVIHKTTFNHSQSWFWKRIHVTSPAWPRLTFTHIHFLKLNKPGQTTVKRERKGEKIKLHGQGRLVLCWKYGGTRQRCSTPSVEQVYTKSLIAIFLLNLQLFTPRGSLETSEQHHDDR